MKKIIINVHSFVDIITNSSTTVYMQCTNKTVEMAKEFVNKLLKVANSDKTADDLFEFKIEGDVDYETDTIYDELKKYKDEIEKIGYSYEEVINGEYDIKSEVSKKIFEKMNNGEIKKHDSWGESYGGYNIERLIITAKNDNKITMDLAGEIKSIFDVDGAFDG